MRWEATFVTEWEKAFVTEWEVTFGEEWEVTFGEEYLTRQYGILKNGGTASRHAIDGVDPLVSVIRGWRPPSRN